MVFKTAMIHDHCVSFVVTVLFLLFPYETGIPNLDMHCFFDIKSTSNTFLVLNSSLCILEIREIHNYSKHTYYQGKGEREADDAFKGTFKLTFNCKKAKRSKYKTQSIKHNQNTG